jgi:hypothetical protein
VRSPLRASSHTPCLRSPPPKRWELFSTSPRTLARAAARIGSCSMCERRFALLACFGVRSWHANPCSPPPLPAASPAALRSLEPAACATGALLSPSPLGLAQPASRTGQSDRPVGPASRTGQSHRPIEPASRAATRGLPAAHQRAAPARNSLYVMESVSASKLASTMLGDTPTVNQRSPVALSRLSTSTRVIASVPPVRMRTL